jgi:hypothetical protein
VVVAVVEEAMLKEEAVVAVAVDILVLIGL